MKQFIKYTRKIDAYLFRLLRMIFVNVEKALVFPSLRSSTPAAGLRRFNRLHYRAIAVVSLSAIPLLDSCTTVKEYEKNKLNDAEMVLGNRTIEKTELSFQSYREGSSGANAGKVGGGCGCN